MHCKANYPARKATSDLDVEVERHIDDAGYMAILAETLARLENLVPEPDLVLYDAGVDVHADDKLTAVSAMTASGRVMGQSCGIIAADIPVATVIGGGYGTDLDEVAFRHSIVFRTALGEYRRTRSTKNQADVT